MSTLRDGSGRPCHKQGHALDIELMVSDIELGNRACTLTFVYDVRPYAALERRFRLMVENSADGITITDQIGRVQYVSPGGARILGFEPEELDRPRRQRRPSIPTICAQRSWPEPGEDRAQHDAVDAQGRQVAVDRGVHDEPHARSVDRRVRLELSRRHRASRGERAAAAQSRRTFAR